MIRQVELAKGFLFHLLCLLAFSTLYVQSTDVPKSVTMIDLMLTCLTEHLRGR